MTAACTSCWQCQQEKLGKFAKKYGPSRQIASQAVWACDDIKTRMNAAFFLPYAKAAAEVGTAAVAQVGKSLAEAGASFAEMLAPKPAEEEQDNKIKDGAIEAGNSSAMLSLVKQIQNQLQAIVQSMGLQLDGEFTLSIDDNGQVHLSGDSDSAATLEQIINSDPALQAKVDALKGACMASGAADQLEAKLRYQAGKLQIQLNEPANDEASGTELPAIAT